MNRIRRKELSKAIELLELAIVMIDACRDEEREAYDNLPEGIQESDRGEMMSGYVYEMEDAIESIDGAIDTLRDNVIEA